MKAVPLYYSHICLKRGSISQLNPLTFENKYRFTSLLWWELLVEEYRKLLWYYMVFFIRAKPIFQKTELL